MFRTAVFLVVPMLCFGEEVCTDTDDGTCGIPVDVDTDTEAALDCTKPVCPSHSIEVDFCPAMYLEKGLCWWLHNPAGCETRLHTSCGHPNTFSERMQRSMRRVCVPSAKIADKPAFADDTWCWNPTDCAWGPYPQVPCEESPCPGTCTISFRCEPTTCGSCAHRCEKCNVVCPKGTTAAAPKECTLQMLAKKQCVKVKECGLTTLCKVV